jgi:uncharacterized repeat protein (TIGR01451 family)
VSATVFASCGAYANTASLTAANFPSLTASATTTVVCPNLTISKVADAATVSAGSPIGFTVTATNGNAVGTGTAAGVVVTDSLPGGTGVNWSIAAGPANCSITGSIGAQVLTCTAVSLAPGASEAVHVTSATSSASCATYANTAALTASNFPSLNASASTTVGQCRQTARITTTETTCLQAWAGSGTDLSTELYGIKRDRIASISAGRFFYYSEVTASGTSLSIQVIQSNTLGWQAMGIEQVVLWDVNCAKRPATVSTSAGNVSVQASGLTPGARYLVAIKYSPQTLIGRSVATKPTNLYTFSTWIGGSKLVGSEDSVTVRPR